MTRFTDNSVRVASFIPRSGYFSDLSNESKRPTRIAVLFISCFHAFKGIFPTGTTYDMLYPLKPKNPI
jgi:hypothetical protein